MAKLLKMADPKVDWVAAMVKRGLTKKKPVAPKVTTPIPTSTPPDITETRDKTISPPETLNSNPPSPEVNEPSKTPLVVSPLSYYTPPINVSEGEEEKERDEGKSTETTDVKGVTEEEGSEIYVEGNETNGVEGADMSVADETGEGIDEGVKVGGVGNVKKAEGEKAEEVETDETMASSGQGDSSAKRKLMMDEDFEELLMGIQAGKAEKDKNYEKIYRECGEDLKEVIERASKKGKLLTYEEVDKVIRVI